MINRLTELREKRENGDKGFALIELLVVVVIIGILIAIAIPLYLNYRKGATDKATQSDVRGAISALEQCMSDNNSYPTGPADLKGNLTGTPACAQKVSQSSGTALKYFTVSATDLSAYIIFGTNPDGNAT